MFNRNAILAVLRTDFLEYLDRITVFAGAAMVINRILPMTDDIDIFVTDEALFYRMASDFTVVTEPTHVVPGVGAGVFFTCGNVEVYYHPELQAAYKPCLAIIDGIYVDDVPSMASWYRVMSSLHPDKAKYRDRLMVCEAASPESDELTYCDVRDAVRRYVESLNISDIADALTVEKQLEEAIRYIAGIDPDHTSILETKYELYELVRRFHEITAMAVDKAAGQETVT